MRKTLLIFTIAVSLLVLTGCEVDTTPSGSEKKETIFNEVKKACDGNDMIYLIDGYREAGLAVVANHPDCVSARNQDSTTFTKEHFEELFMRVAVVSLPETPTKEN